MNLKRLKSLRGIAFVILSGATVLTGCSKEVNGNGASVNSANEAALASAEPSSALLSDTALAKFFKGTFGSRGSRTDYRGEISDTTATISLDFFIQKKFKRGENGKLLLDYADGGLSSKGWQYEVTIDRATGNIELAPNSIMTSQIVPGSFKAVSVSFDKFSSAFSFLTEVKETKTNTVHQVFELVAKQ